MEHFYDFVRQWRKISKRYRSFGRCFSIFACLLASLYSCMDINEINNKENNRGVSLKGSSWGDLELSFEDGTMSKNIEYDEFAIKLKYKVDTYNYNYEFSYFSFQIMNGGRGYDLYVADENFTVARDFRPYEGYRYEGYIPVNFYRPGDYVIQVKAVIVNDDTYETSETEIAELHLVMEYPNNEKILASNVRYYEMESCWNSTLSENKEYGFPIYLRDGVLVTAGRETGETAKCPDKSGEIVENSVTYSYNDISVNPTQMGARYLVGLFHTHPPINKCDDNVWKKLGPSSKDKEIIKTYNIQVPGFVYDYDDVGSQYVYGGHELYLNAKIYTYGVERRDYNLDEYPDELHGR
ncbi:hypothetical protein [Bacteroides ovatus]|uniref:DUF4329 domain-containing protein n=1 Tax=Bacteroides ovatus TaxID=28116 RepID=A0A1G8M0X5_BACOV|nr:hypothetical protein [Bacteroides ovatus]SDI61588.1 hypothetical protein SAMN05192582_105915 [Bacteroides ovatus]